MNKILNINLGGFALTIDDDAFEYLSSYLDSIRRRFRESDGRDEILKDIETRLGELITDNMGNRTIVMLPDVQAAVEIMGKPEDFGGEPVEQRRKQSSQSQGSGIRTGKRLFRDEEDKVAAGVCSGLSAYFGIQDPVWMRLIFVLLTFISAGFWIPAYLLLWILVPPAKSAADRLAMRGEPVNVDNIAREIEEGFDRFGNRVSSMTDEFKKKGSTTGGRLTNVLGSILIFIGQIFGFFIRLLAKFGLLILILIGIGLLIALASSWIAGLWALMVAAPLVSFFSPFSSGVNWFAFLVIFLLFGIPLVGLILLFSRALFKARTPAWVGTSLVATWVFSVIAGFGLLSFGFKGFSSRSEVEKNIDLSGLTSDTLRVNGIGDGDLNFHFDDDDWWHDEKKYLRNGKLAIPGDIEILVQPSRDNRFRIIQTISARGSSNENAVQNAANVDFEATLQGNALNVPVYYSLAPGTKWRKQEVKLVVEMPVGKSIVFDEQISNKANAEYVDYADNNSDELADNPGKVFTMTKDGLRCTECPQWGDRNFREDRSYDEFILEGDFTTEIRRGDDFEYHIEGNDSIQVIRTGDQVTFTTGGRKVSSNSRVIIQTPVFTKLMADNAGDVTIRGFDEGNASISARGKSKIKGFFDCSDLSVMLSGPGKLELVGTGNNLEVNMSDGAELDALNWRADHVEIFATENANARVFSKNSYKKRTDASSTVKIDGPGNEIE